MTTLLEHRDPDPSHETGPANELFQRHARSPQHLGLLAQPDGCAAAKGTCGDVIEMSIRLEGDLISQIGHQPNGCVYTVACASAVSALACGKHIDDVLELQAEDVDRELGGLPEDHLHCARLAVNTLGEAIEDAYKALARTKANTEEEKE